MSETSEPTAASTWEPGEVITTSPRTSLTAQIEDLLHEFDGVESKRIIADEIVNRLLGETEWGYRAPWGATTPQPSEAEARRWVDMAIPGARVLVRREVGAWTEVPRD